MLQAECHITIKRNGVVLLDPLKTDLLHELKRTGRLHAAAAKLNITYQQASDLVDELNSISSQPIVMCQPESTNARNVTISLFGENMLREYYSFVEKANAVVRIMHVDITL